MNKTVCITGGSEGIGYSFAEWFAKEGDSLILIARNREHLLQAKQKLDKKYKVQVRVMVADLSRKESRDSVLDELEKESVDVLVNNAGRGYTGRITDCDRDTIENLVTLNVIAVEVFCASMAKKMAERHSGRILNVCSTGAFQCGPYIASYYSSKADVLSFSEALRMEMQSCGVQVQTLCFGPVRTGFYEKAHSRAPWHAMNPDKAVALAMKSKKNVVIPGMQNRLCLLIPEKLRSLFVKKSKLKQIPEER